MNVVAAIKLQQCFLMTGHLWRPNGPLYYGIGEVITLAALFLAFNNVCTCT